MVRRMTLLATVVSAFGSLHASPAAPQVNDPAVARFLLSDQPALTSFRARRHMEASTRGGSMQATLDAWTNLSPDGTFPFEVIRETGSDLIRGHVLRAALIEEQRARAAHEIDAAALTPLNYDLLIGAAGGDLVRITLAPRRRSRMLVAGAAFVTSEGDLVAVEGTLAKTPSFWTRRVDVTRRYARIGGVRVPVEMRSTADVRVVGASTFAMTYEYSMINGRRVDQR